jgi:glutamyl-tRNA reductase
MVVGEAQIVAQLKAAYQLACDGGCTAVVFNRLFRHALEVGKRVRTETAIGERPVSVSSAAVELALQVFGKLRDHTVLIVGAGETSELTATHLKAHGIEKILVANRTLATSRSWPAWRRAVRFEDSSSTSPRRHRHQPTSAPHTSSPGDVGALAPPSPPMFHRHRRPRDLTRDQPRARRLPLRHRRPQHVVEHNRHEREKEAQHAEHIVEQELASVNDWLRSLEVVPTIATLREAVEEIRRGELERLSNRLSDLTDEQRAQVDMLTASIVNKILHVPTVKMKEVAGRDQCYLYVDAVRTLFDLDDDEDGAGGAGRRDGGADGASCPRPGGTSTTCAAPGRRTREERRSTLTAYPHRLPRLSASLLVQAEGARPRRRAPSDSAWRSASTPRRQDPRRAARQDGTRGCSPGTETAADGRRRRRALSQRHAHNGPRV